MASEEDLRSGKTRKDSDTHHFKLEKIMSNTLYSIVYYGAHSVAGCFVTYLIYLHSNGFLFLL
jgi:hypothetical protein